MESVSWCGAGVPVICRYCWRNSNEWSNDMVLCGTTLIEKNAMKTRYRNIKTNHLGMRNFVKLFL